VHYHLTFPFTAKHVKSLYYGQCYSLTRQSRRCWWN